MIIVADIGNSYLKFARWDGRRLSDHLRVRHRDLRDVDWRAGLKSSIGDKTDRVFISSVADAGVEQVFESWLTSHGHGRPVYVKSEREAGGIVNAYAQPEKLGVDRWCAMVAVHAEYSGPFCVVDVGTATTLDWVDAEGRHQGGVIMPGPSLQAESLFKSTRHLHEESGVPTGLFADNTADAVVSGACFSSVALIEFAMANIADRSDTRPSLFLTGGEAGRIMPLLESEAILQPDLVLRGVVRLADQDRD